jgi:hypothetical protein
MNLLGFDVLIMSTALLLKELLSPVDVYLHFQLIKRFMGLCFFDVCYNPFCSKISSFESDELLGLRIKKAFMVLK